MNLVSEPLGVVIGNLNSMLESGTGAQRHIGEWRRLGPCGVDVHLRPHRRAAEATTRTSSAMGF
jgi:hypothetical protein